MDAQVAPLTQCLDGLSPRLFRDTYQTDTRCQCTVFHVTVFDDTQLARPASCTYLLRPRHVDAQSTFTASFDDPSDPLHECDSPGVDANDTRKATQDAGVDGGVECRLRKASRRA